MIQKTHSPNVFIQERDELILNALLKYRYLTTSMIESLFFSENKSRTACLRRLKKLRDAEFIDYIITQNPSTRLKGENCYFIIQKGYEYLGSDLHFYKKQKNNNNFLLHSIERVRFRIKTEKDIFNNRIAKLNSWTTEFDLENPNASRMDEKYLLFNYVYDTNKNIRYSFYPDDMFLLQGKGEFEDFRSLYFVEIDMGTESHSVIKKKVLSAYIYLSNEFHKRDFCNTDKVRVLFITNSKTRSVNIIDSLTNVDGVEWFRFSDFDSVHSDNVFTDNIWLKSDGEIISLIK